MKRLLAVAVVGGILALAGCGTTVPLSTRQAVYGGGSSLTVPGQSDGLGNGAVVPTSPAGQPSTVDPTTGLPPVDGGTASQPGGGVPTTSTTVDSTASSDGGGKKGLTTPPTVAAHIPTTGPGWDAHNVYIGVMTANDFSGYAATLGAKNADPGNQVKDAQAMADQINRQGGLLGRKVVIVFNNVSTASLLVNPAGDGAQACTHFVQDRRVIAAYNDISPIDLPSFRSCFAQAKVPLFEGSIQATPRSALDATHGYVTSVVSPAFTDVATTFVQRLKAEHYFTGWNVEGAKRGTAPVKVGIVTQNVPGDLQAAQALAGALARAGYPPTAQFNYTEGATGTTTNLSSAVLQFRSRGITHVIGADAGTGAFILQANPQRYFPRYGINTINLPASGLAEDAPPKQLNGALGIGWYPTLDVDTAHDPGFLSKNSKPCLQALQAHQKFATRFAYGIGTSFCDTFGLIRAAVLAGGGFTGPQLVHGEALAGPTYVPSGTFSSDLHQGDWAIPGSGRDLGWVGKCQCFEYLSKTDYAFGS